MSYRDALVAAGADVIAFKNFGSYQGDWWAKVSVNGTIGWIHGYFGSCSGCDAFEGEFGYGAEHCDEHWGGAEMGCEECSTKGAEYRKKLAEFGAGYLEKVCSHDEAVRLASENLDWDTDAQEMVDWIKSNETGVTP